jgi:putative transposase
MNPSPQNRPRRRSTRISNYDYSQAGAYFVTICIHDNVCLLGNIDDGVVKLSPIGRLVEEAWLNIRDRFPRVELDKHVVMPNHFHGILSIGLEPDSSSATDPTCRPSLSEVVRIFKSTSAVQANQALEQPRNPFWHRGFYERVIRDEAELYRIQTYIVNNPYKWNEDKYNLRSK